MTLFAAVICCGRQRCWTNSTPTASLSPRGGGWAEFDESGKERRLFFQSVSVSSLIISTSQIHSCFQSVNEISGQGDLGFFFFFLVGVFAWFLFCATIH